MRVDGERVVRIRCPLELADEEMSRRDEAIRTIINGSDGVFDGILRITQGDIPNLSTLNSQGFEVVTELLTEECIIAIPELLSGVAANEEVLDFILGECGVPENISGAALSHLLQNEQLRYDENGRLVSA